MKITEKNWFSNHPVYWRQDVHIYWQAESPVVYYGLYIMNNRYQFRDLAKCFQWSTTTCIYPLRCRKTRIRFLFFSQIHVPIDLERYRHQNPKECRIIEKIPPLIYCQTFVKKYVCFRKRNKNFSKCIYVSIYIYIWICVKWNHDECIIIILPLQYEYGVHISK